MGRGLDGLRGHNACSLKSSPALFAGGEDLEGGQKWCQLQLVQQFALT